MKTEWFRRDCRREEWKRRYRIQVMCFKLQILSYWDGRKEKFTFGFKTEREEEEERYLEEQCRQDQKLNQNMDVSVMMFDINHGYRR